MSRIKFRTLYVENFMVIRELDIDLDRNGLYLVAGDNQDDPGRSNKSGKSTIWEALAWCLYGRTIRELPDKASVLHVSRSAETRVSVTLSLREIGGLYRVGRSYSERKSSLLVEAASPNGWNSVTGGTQATTQDVLENMLGMDFKAFCSSVVFGGSSAFKFSSLSDAERMEVLNDACGGSLYLRAAEHARLEALKHERALEVLKHDARSIRDAIAVARRDRDFLAKSIVDRKGEVKADFKRQAEAIKEKIRGAGVGAKDVDDLKEEERRVGAVRQNYEKLAAKHEAERAQALALFERLKEFSERSTARCPTCGSDLDKKRVEILISTWENYAESAEYEKNEALKKVSFSSRKAEDLGQQIRDEQWRQKEIEILQRDLEDLKRKNEPSDLEEVLKDKKAKVLELYTKLKGVKTEISSRRKEAKTYRFLVDAFGRGGMASDAVESAVPALNEVAASVMAAVSGGQTTAVFSTTTVTKAGKEQAKLTIEVGGDSGAQSYEAGSQGEKAEIDFAAGMAIQALVAGKSSCNLAVYDEVLDHLDGVGAERVAKLLKEEARSKAVFLVTHSSEIRDMIQFDGFVEVRKKGGSATATFKGDGR